MKNIYVGNLPYSVKSRELREAFEAYGAVNSAEVIFDRRTKRSRGYGFVEMENDSEAIKAIETLNGSDFNGRELRVDESLPRDQKPTRSNTERNHNRASNSNVATGQAAVVAAGGGDGGGLFGFVKKLFG